MFARFVLLQINVIFGQAGSPLRGYAAYRRADAGIRQILISLHLYRAVANDRCSLFFAESCLFSERHGSSLIIY